jgi:glutamyl-tRNA reductase
MALDELGDDAAHADVVVVGAGQLASGVVKSLLGSSSPLAHVVILNRTMQTAHTLANELEDPRVVVGDFASLASQVLRARLAIVAVETSSPLLTKSDLAGATSPLLVVDLGVPRAVASDVDELANVTRVDIGDLREQIERVLDERHEAADAAVEIVVADVEKYLVDQRARGAAAIVRELRQHFDEIVEAELTKREGELGEFSDEQREKVRSLIRSVVAKIAHRPTVALKEAAGTDQGIRLNEATRSLFDL